MSAAPDDADPSSLRRAEPSPGPAASQQPPADSARPAEAPATPPQAAAPPSPQPPEGAPRFERTIFFVSDGTGITAETFGHSLLTQFEPMRLRQVRLPFIDSPEKAHQAVERIDRQALIDGNRPVVFSTLIDPAINDIVRMANCRYLDLFATFVEPLESEFGVRSTHTVGRSHTATDTEAYQRRIAAINYALAHDDGQTHAELDHADVILIGVSRSGKTPTSLYLAMQHGIRAANYPLVPEDFERKRLPEVLYRYKPKLFGLSIAPERLAEIRNERRPGSRYASLENCRYEVREGEALMRREGIRCLSSTTKSIEEIATTILHELDLP
ncbi:MAG TPA: pyruvate, water dikinase regulatory protein [Zeimonas sp.]|nr:pyruvate, water dikinase regulatory protein [Zeimonas sp.]